MQSKYKVGDIVEIAQRTHSQYDYACLFVNDMTYYSGQSAVIVEVRPLESPVEKKRPLYTEPYYYILRFKGHNHNCLYYWTNEMFEQTSDALPKCSIF